MRTVYFRRPKTQLLVACLCLFVVILYFRRSSPTTYASREDAPPPFGGMDPEGAVHPRVQAPIDLVKEHRGPHQPDAVKKHLGDAHAAAGGEDNVVAPGDVPDNAEVAQEAINAVHEAAEVEEKQENANLLPPGNILPDQAAAAQPKLDQEAKNEEDDGGIPFHLTPRRPPQMSTAYSKGPGEGGKAVTIDKDSLSSEERKKFEEGEKNNAFNEYASNMISVRRFLPDIREKQCLDFEYNQKHEPASIILCFHNEAWSVLLRSVHSILDRSEEELVHEVILVDDASTMDHLKKPLEVYMAGLDKVKIVRAEERQGLIRARMLGAKAATGKVLVFLDSHIECTTGWLKPLLDRIAENYTNVVVPVIDVISADTLAYNHASSRSIQVGGFDWNLIFRWHPIPERDANRPGAPNSPVRTPTMAGGLFAISSKFFSELGWYDPGYEVWGAENLELSFKTWMCGGQLETIPCSHVGHIFRARSPYSWKVKQANPLKHNLLRLAEVVLGEDFKYYYFSRVNYREDVDQAEMGDVSERKKILVDLKCKSFKWYLDNIYPEMFIPGESLASGEIRNVLTGHCADAPTSDKKAKTRLVGYPCHNQGGNQFWLLSKTNELRRDDYCFDTGFESPFITISSCHAQAGNQHFVYNDKDEIRQRNLCMTISMDGKSITMEQCDGSDRQKWSMNRKPFQPAGHGKQVDKAL